MIECRACGFRGEYSEWHEVLTRKQSPDSYEWTLHVPGHGSAYLVACPVCATVRLVPKEYEPSKKGEAK